MAGNITKEVLLQLMNSSTPMWVFCEETNQLLEANLACVQKFEFSNDELLRMSADDLICITDKIRYLNAIDTPPINTPLSQVWKMSTKLGREVYALHSDSVFMYDNRRVRLVTCFEVDEQFYTQDNKIAIPLSDLLKIISHFDFEKPRSNKNKTLLNHLKSATRQLESIMFQEPAVN